VKERPIIFNTEMVKAILEGRKTQTRRIIKPQPINSLLGYQIQDDPSFAVTIGPDHPSDGVSCPYGKPGDRLWVREVWKIVGWDCEILEMTIMFKDGKERGDVVLSEDGDRLESYYIQCSDQCIDAGLKTLEMPTIWRSPRFMPRTASRINLAITDIRVERLQEIKEEEIYKEGIKIPVTKDKKPLICLTGKYPTCNYFDQDKKNYAEAGFASLWDSINYKKGFGWEANPWVWVIEFKVI